MEVAISKTKKILPPEGVHNARCIQLVDLGTQETEWEGKISMKHQIKLAFELVDETAIFNEDKGEQNFVLYRTYTLSLAPKATLAIHISAWLNKKFGKSDSFDLNELLNAPCQIQVRHNESKEYANIVAIMAPPKGVKVAKASNDCFSVFLTEEEFDQDSFDLLPNFMKEKLAATEEFAACGGSFEAEEEKPTKKVKKKAVEDDDDDDEEEEVVVRRRRLRQSLLRKVRGRL